MTFISTLGGWYEIKCSAKAHFFNGKVLPSSCFILAPLTFSLSKDESISALCVCATGEGPWNATLP